jgi:hypothetical protein
MKILGLILIALQVLAYASGKFKPDYDSIGYLLGFNIVGIIGLVLFIIAINKKRKTY